ncbi:MAG TPA: ABC transporter permease [Pyrodictium delaneyi]|uniref:ABC transporter permease n=1 Tax=Pyrodictium delaneyi TaxID=1273541 RepID=A0A833E9I6_9CREN|nr:ABC transporter permease [Pyrodictium delaneyi]
MVDVTAILLQGIPEATVLALAALGELVLERSGLINLGLEGMLYFGSALAAYVAVSTGSLVAGFAAGMLAGILLAIVYILLVVGLKADQAVTGLALVFLGIGLGDVMGSATQGALAPALSGLGESLVAFTVLVPLPAILYAILYRSWRGYALRSLGEDEDAARMLGVNVTATRILAALVAGAAAGAAGAFFLMGPSNGRWSAGRAIGWGWLALGTVILGYWHPVGVVAAAYLLGVLYAVTPLLQGLGVHAALADAVPYIVVVTALTLISWMYERVGVKPPAAVWRR